MYPVPELSLCAGEEEASKRAKSVVAGFLKHQRLARRKCETLVYTPRFSWRRLIKWHTLFVTTDSCARRPKRPGFLLGAVLSGVAPTLRGDTRSNGFLPGTAGVLPAFPSSVWSPTI